MPTQAAPIGSTLTDITSGSDGLVIGYKHIGTKIYHLYFKDENICQYVSDNILFHKWNPTTKSIQTAQTIALAIQNRPKLVSAKYAFGTMIISHKFYAEDIDYIIIDDGQQLPDGRIIYLIAYKCKSATKWFVDYQPEDANMFTLPKTLPTQESIALAKSILFEYVTSHAFTKF